jgi:hypothetical protein
MPTAPLFLKLQCSCNYSCFQSATPVDTAGFVTLPLTECHDALHSNTLLAYDACCSNSDVIKVLAVTKIPPK